MVGSSLSAPFRLIQPSFTGDVGGNSDGADAGRSSPTSPVHGDDRRDFEVTTDREQTDNDEELMSEILFYARLHQMAVPTVFCLIIVVGVVGNSLVVGVTLSRPKMRSSTVGLLLLNLAASDLLFLIVCVPFMTYHYVADTWRLGEVTCKLAQYTLYVTVYVTVYTLVAIAVLRFVRIVCWSSRSNVLPETSRRLGIIVVAVWITMLVVNSPVLVLYRVKTIKSENPADEPYYYCGLDSHEVNGPRLTATFFAFAYVGPLTIIATMYLLILRFLRNRRRQSTLAGSTRSEMRPLRGGGGGSGVISILGRRRDAATSEASVSAVGGAVVISRERRRTSYATRIFLAVVVVFGLCWLPLHAHLLLVMFDRQPTSHSYAVWRVLCHALAYANSSVNPFIYHYVSADFRRSLNAIVTSATARCRHRLMARSSSTVAAPTAERTTRQHSVRFGVAGRVGCEEAGVGDFSTSVANARAAVATLQCDSVARPTCDAVSGRPTMTTHVEMCRLPARRQSLLLLRQNRLLDDETSSQCPST